MAVIKANAYGHGLVPAAKALAQSGRLRGRAPGGRPGAARCGAHQPHPAARRCVQHGATGRGRAAALRPDGAQLRADSRCSRRVAGSDVVSAWIKVDTGMNRLGFRLEQFGAAYDRLRRIGNVAADPTALMTHLANADDRRDAMTASQLQSFASADGGPRRRAQHRQFRRHCSPGRTRARTGCAPAWCCTACRRSRAAWAPNSGCGR